jgi:hypothetical protein
VIEDTHDFTGNVSFERNLYVEGLPFKVCIIDGPVSFVDVYDRCYSGHAPMKELSKLSKCAPVQLEQVGVTDRDTTMTLETTALSFSIQQARTYC